MTDTMKFFWKHLSSTRLAIFILITLAVVSIAGTIIPQGESHTVYVERFGIQGSQFITLLRLDNMFSAGWYIALLSLFSVNLIACSCERIPNVFRILRQDNLSMDSDWIMRRPFRRTLASTLAPKEVQDRLAELLRGLGWQASVATLTDGGVLFAQKCSWARLSAYMVHTGILVVLIGAIIGKVYGFKTSVFIPEGPLVAGQRENAPVPLPFDIRCDSFEIEYYDTGQPRQYRSGITLFQEGQEVHRAMLAVNDPMEYAGITLYQDRYKAMENQYIVQVQSLASGVERAFRVTPHKEYSWPEEKLVFGLDRMENPDAFTRDEYGHDHGTRKNVRHELAVVAGSGPVSRLWANENTATTLAGESGGYAFTVRQRYYTGLQIVKDPGVWWVYAGFAFMLTGLISVFSLSHRRIWIMISPRGSNETAITLCGATSRNRAAFSHFFHQLTEAVAQETGALPPTAGSSSALPEGKILPPSASC